MDIGRSTTLVDCKKCPFSEELCKAARGILNCGDLCPLAKVIRPENRVTGNSPTD